MEVIKIKAGEHFAAPIGTAPGTYVIEYEVPPLRGISTATCDPNLTVEQIEHSFATENKSARLRKIMRVEVPCLECDVIGKAACPDHGREPASDNLDAEPV